MLLIRIDSLNCRRYFVHTRDADLDAFEARVKRYSNSLSSNCREDLNSPDLIASCERIDSIKNYWIAQKEVSDIDFYDLENMYRAISKEMANLYNSLGIELIPLDEYLTMSCWLAGDRAVLAFPSKWASDEIGFFSQDPAFVRYITAMLTGVRSSLW